MNVFEDFFNYGYHDTLVDRICVNFNSVSLFFCKGVYELSKDGKEETLVGPCRMVFNIDTHYNKMENYLGIYTSSLKQNDGVDKFITLANKYKLYIFDIFYSRFNNTFLIEASLKNKMYLIKIENCIEFGLIKD